MNLWWTCLNPCVNSCDSFTCRPGILCRDFVDGSSIRTDDLPTINTNLCLLNTGWHLSLPTVPGHPAYASDPPGSTTRLATLLSPHSLLNPHGRREDTYQVVQVEGEDM